MFPHPLYFERKRLCRRKAVGPAVFDEGGFERYAMRDVLDLGERDDPKDMPEFFGIDISGEPDPAPLAFDLQVGHDLPDVVHQYLFPAPADRVRF